MFFYGLTTMDIRGLAFDLAEKMKLQHPFSMKLKLAGSEWLRSSGPYAKGGGLRGL